MRFGQNALTTIERVKQRLKDIAPGLPPGVVMRPVYDRSDLIERAIANLRGKLLEESLVVALVCIIFLLHARSALVAILTLPVGILMAFVAMRGMKVGADIMSLGGIAIAIGAMIDAAIVMIENMHKHLERAVTAKERAAAPEPHSRAGSTGVRPSGAMAVGLQVGPALLSRADHHGVVRPPALEAGRTVVSPLAHTKTLRWRRPACCRDAGAGHDGIFSAVTARDGHPVNRLLIRAYAVITFSFGIAARHWCRCRDYDPHLDSLDTNRQRVHAAAR